MNDPLDTVRLLTPDVEPDASALPRVRADLFAHIGSASTTTSTDAPLSHGRRRPRHRRTVRRVVVPVVAAVTVLGAAAATWVATRPSSETLSVLCPDRSIIPVASGNPVTDCTAHWQSTHDGTPPPMVAYDNGIGGVEVRLATQAAPVHGTRIDPNHYQDSTAAQLEANLADLATGLPGACDGVDGATSLIEAELHRLGMDGWSVGVESDRAPKGDTRCTDAYLEVGEKRVVIFDGGPSIDGKPAHAWPVADFARKLHAQLGATCLSLDDAEAATRTLADATTVTVGDQDVTIGATMILTRTEDPSATCTEPTVQEGGTTIISLRGPAAVDTASR